MNITETSIGLDHYNMFLRIKYYVDLKINLQIIQKILFFVEVLS